MPLIISTQNTLNSICDCYKCPLQLTINAISRSSQKTFVYKRQVSQAHYVNGHYYSSSEHRQNTINLYDNSHLFKIHQLMLLSILTDAVSATFIFGTEQCLP